MVVNTNCSNKLQEYCDKAPDKSNCLRPRMAACMYMPEPRFVNRQNIITRPFRIGIEVECFLVFLKYLISWLISSKSVFHNHSSATYRFDSGLYHKPQAGTLQRHPGSSYNGACSMDSGFRERYCHKGWVTMTFESLSFAWPIQWRAPTEAWHVCTGRMKETSLMRFQLLY
jgi:hypothetical protein